MSAPARVSLGRRARNLWKNIPDGRVKQTIRRIVRVVVPNPYPTSYVEELRKLDVAKAGVSEDGLPFIRLGGGTILFGSGPVRDPSKDYHDSGAYRVLPPEVRRRIPRECVRLALDVVQRYVYPHAMPHIRPPYPFQERNSHWLAPHWDTIDDLPGLSDQAKASLKARFALREGDVALDVGAFYGFGAVRWSRMVGAHGLVVAIEADPTVQAILRRNIEANDLQNVKLVPCGVWKEPGELVLHLGSVHRQDNSLREGVHPSSGTITVPTDTIDNIVRQLNLDRLTLVSITINTAEVEAIQGMDSTLRHLAPNVHIAGWLVREGRRVHEWITQQLSAYDDYEVVVGPSGRVLAWSTTRATRNP